MTASPGEFIHRWKQRQRAFQRTVLKLKLQAVQWSKQEKAFASQFLWEAQLELGGGTC